MKLNVNGRLLETTRDGFLVDLCDWDEDAARLLARADAVELTDAHWEIIHFIRSYYLSFNHLPNARIFTLAIRKALGEEKGNSRYLHRLFPDGPLKYACKIGGLPKPPTCI